MTVCSAHVWFMFIRVEREKEKEREEETERDRERLFELLLPSDPEMHRVWLLFERCTTASKREVPSLLHSPPFLHLRLLLLLLLLFTTIPNLTSAAPRLRPRLLLHTTATTTTLLSTYMQCYS